LNIMDNYGVRALIALLLAVFLFVQSRGAAAQPQRRRAFWLGAAALLMLAAYNGTLLLDATPGPLQTGLAVAGMALFVGAVVSLVLSFSSGELRGERERIAAAAREFREQREEQARKKSDSR
jgi:drug/metabolite transporter (DMT)-like permease